MCTFTIRLQDLYKYWRSTTIRFYDLNYVRASIKEGLFYFRTHKNNCGSPEIFEDPLKYNNCFYKLHVNLLNFDWFNTRVIFCSITCLRGWSEIRIDIAVARIFRFVKPVCIGNYLTQPQGYNPTGIPHLGSNADS